MTSSRPRQAYRLSLPQRRLWPPVSDDPSGHEVRVTVRLEGPLDRERLCAAVAAVIDRHEILRTAFRRPAGVKVPVQEVSGRAETDWAEAGDGLEAWDLERDSLLRCRWRRLGDELHTLDLSLPALCGDAASLAIVLREVGAIYANGPKALDGDPVQYAEFADWQAEQTGSNEAADDRGFWAERHPAQPPGLPEVRGGGRLTLERTPVELGAELSEALARAGGDEAECFLLACWFALLARLGHRREVAVHVVVGGRVFEDLEGGVGPFDTAVPLVEVVERDFTVNELRDRIAGALEEASQHADAPFWLGDDGAPDDGARFELRHWPAPFEADGVRISVTDAAAVAAPFRLGLAVDDHGDGTWRVALEIDRSRYEAGLGRSLAEAFAALARAAWGGRADGSLRVGSLPLLDESERRRLLEDWNRSPEGEVGEPVAVLEGFLATAADLAGSPALTCDGETLTYGELDERSWALAARLRAAGIGPGRRVALVLDRSPAWGVAALAAWKAGACYVGLDGEAPAARVATMLEEVSAAAVVTGIGAAAVPAGYHGPVVEVDDLGALGAPPAVEPWPVAVVPEALAYVLFTSGSTGRPKAVGVSHRALGGYVAAIVARLELEPGWRYGVLSTLAADLGLTMLYPALITGGAVELVPRGSAADTEALGEIFSEIGLDCLKVVPSHLAALLSGAEPERLLPRRRLVLGGEATTPELLARLRELKPAGCRIFNHYGPTESTVGVTCGELDALAGDGPVALGRPLPSRTVYVVDAGFEPLPAGVEGELCAGGGGVARGYLARPAATAERFVPDPFGGGVGARLYRTGDRVRRTAAGELLFLGRLDRQLKVRGHRVEPGEVEAALLRDPAVREAVVDLRGERLVGYVVRRPGSAGSGEALRDALRASLPEPMVPSRVVVVESLPLTPNGKIDRAALPDPEEVEPVRRDTTPPSTPAEELLVRIWRDVLGLAELGVHDDFFELGGHSLAAAQVIYRVREELEVDVPVNAMFELPVTVARLARRVDAEKRGGRPAPELTAKDRPERLPLSFAQQRLWFVEQLRPGTGAYNRSYSARLRGPLDLEALDLALATLVDRHEVLRTGFRSVRGEPEQVVEERPRARVRLVEVSDEATGAEPVEEVARRLALREALQPFDLERPPLLRATVFRLTDDDHALLFVTHHIVGDGLSSQIFVSELAVAYRAHAAGETPALPDLPLQYPDYAVWQREWLRDDVLEEQLAYWRRTLDGVPPVLDLQADRPRTAHRSPAGASEVVFLTAERAEALREIGRDAGGTLFMAVLSIFQALLGHRSGERRLVVGSPVAGRGHVDLGRLMGCFVNLLPFVADLSGEPTFRELLGRTRTTALGAFAHQDLPFDLLVERLGLERDAAHDPLVQVAFTLTEGADDPPEFADLDLDLFELGTADVQFDLVFGVLAGESAMVVHADYARDLFDPPTVRALLDDVDRVLVRVTEDPDVRLSALYEELDRAAAERREAVEERLEQSSAVRFHQLRPRSGRAAGVGGGE